MKIFISLIFFLTISMIKADDDDYSMPNDLYEELEAYYESDYQMAKGDDDPDASRYCKYDYENEYDDDYEKKDDDYKKEDNDKKSLKDKLNNFFENGKKEDDKKKEKVKDVLQYKAYIPMNPCKCKSLWCFIKAVKALILKLHKYHQNLSGLPCYLKKKILNIILEFYLRGCPDFLRDIITKWVNYYINKWC